MKRKNSQLLFIIAMAALIVFVSINVAAALPEISSSKFASANTCACHGTFLSQWSASMHAKALTDPLYTLKRDKANKETNGAVGKFCDGCHAPVAIMAGEDTSKVENLPAQSKESVGCEFCHQVSGSTMPLGNTSIEVASDGARRAQLEDAQAPHPVAYSRFHTTAEFCGNCHNVNHPANGLALEATYTEWKNGPYAKDGIVCQDCHMTPGVGPTINPGAVAVGAPARDHIFNMTFAGGNVGLGDSKLAEERLKGAATLGIAVNDVVPTGSKTTVTVTVANSGAGHYLPTGLTDTRQMWLVITATTGNGAEKELFRRDFGTVFADDDGNAPVQIWAATKVKSDDRIPPKESITENITFLQEDAKATTIQAALYYRSASPEMAREANVDIPTTTMASQKAVIYASDQAKANTQASEPFAQPAKKTPWLLYGSSAVSIIGLIAVAICRNFVELS